MTGRVAIVTGVSRASGIGHACCTLFAQNGYRVVGIDRTSLPSATEGAQWASFREASPMAPWRYLQLDLTDRPAVARLPDALRDGGVTQVHVLVNNAAIVDPYLPPCHLQDRLDAWDAYIRTNLTAPFVLSEVLQPMMVVGHSSIIHISSTRALQSEPNQEGYAAAKAGLLGLTHAQASSLAGTIRVNAVLPGWIDTSSSSSSTGPQAAGRMEEGGGGEPSVTEEQHEWHWTGGVGRPDDVAQMVLFLADEVKSGFITGQQFVLDGGTTRRMHYPE